jgi:hypothetical protein
VHIVLNLNEMAFFSPDVTMEQLNQRLKGHGELYVHGRDKDGKVLMVFAVKKHIKGTEKMDDLKTFFIYMMERIDRFRLPFLICPSFHTRFY